MKKNKILIVVLLAQLFFIGSVQAACDLQSFRFGISHKALMDKLKLDDFYVMPKIVGASKQEVYAPGEKVCKNEKSFEGAGIEFVLLYDKLVEIQISKLSESPSLVNWAESVFGVKPDKPTNFFDAKPNAQWLWVDSKSVIYYSIEPDAESLLEMVVIQSRNHQSYFSKFGKEQEEQ